VRDELASIWEAIENESLPAEFEKLLAPNWIAEEERFHSQETFLIDFKDRAPAKLADAYGIAIQRLALGFYNAFGGLIIFGVSDDGFRPSSLPVDLDVEGFNNELKRISNRPIECQFKRYTIPNTACQVGVLLVPKRGHSAPARLQVRLGDYAVGTVWVRDRHEVAVADGSHVAMLYSARTELPSENQSQNLPIHKSLPPSPATMHEFMGRDQLMLELWDWLVFSGRPRLYVHGPGGSGKSTLAYEFARSIADKGFNIRLSASEHVDYVLYLSAKETEFNPLSGTQQDFALRQFSDADSEFRQILFHSGFADEDTVNSASGDEVEAMLADLFGTYSGLIVLDDIDALSRRGRNTGEETLFLAAARAAKTTRILYTLRFPPSHAAGSGVAVPGLDGEEFCEFVELCSSQFGVSPPPAQHSVVVQEKTNGLPLLIETVVGLRRFTGNYKEALNQFADKGGDDARRYLYQREYDTLSKEGKARDILAALSLLQEPVHFAVLQTLLAFPPNVIRDGLSECGTIFITTAEDTFGDTLYQLTPPSVPFIRNVSQRLPRYQQIERKIQLYRRTSSSLTPQEAGLLYRMQKLMRAREFQKVVELCDALDVNDPCLANPRIRALLGQSLVNLGPSHSERARECFKLAESLGVRDLPMIRDWYFMEMRSGYGHEEAKALCRKMIDRAGVTPRVQSEFLSKHARCIFEQANSLSSVSLEKALPLYRQSIEEYLEAICIAEKDANMTTAENLGWLQRPVNGMLRLLRGDLDPFLKLIEDWAKKRGEIPLDAATVLIHGITSAYIPNDERSRRRLLGLFTRTRDRLTRIEADDTPGLRYTIQSLDAFCSQISSLVATPS
jgi:hypothetical protein